MRRLLVHVTIIISLAGCVGLNGCIFTRNLWEAAGPSRATKPIVVAIIPRTEHPHFTGDLVVEYRVTGGLFLGFESYPVLIPLDGYARPTTRPAESFDCDDFNRARQELKQHKTIPFDPRKSPFEEGFQPIVSLPLSVRVPQADRFCRVSAGILLTPVAVSFDIIDDATLGMFWWTDGFFLGVSSSTPGLH